MRVANQQVDSLNGVQKNDVGVRKAIRNELLGM